MVSPLIGSKGVRSPVDADLAMLGTRGSVRQTGTARASLSPSPQQGRQGHGVDRDIGISHHIVVAWMFEKSERGKSNAEAIADVGSSIGLDMWA